MTCPPTKTESRGVTGVVKPSQTNCTASMSYRSRVPLWIWIWNWFLAGSSRFCVGTATSAPSGISILGSVVVVTAGSVVAGVVGATLVDAVASVASVVVVVLDAVATVAGGLATVVTVVVTVASGSDRGIGASSAQAADVSVNASPA